MSTGWYLLDRTHWTLRIGLHVLYCSDSQDCSAAPCVTPPMCYCVFICCTLRHATPMCYCVSICCTLCHATRVLVLIEKLLREEVVGQYASGTQTLYSCIVRYSSLWYSASQGLERLTASSLMSPPSISPIPSPRLGLHAFESQSCDQSECMYPHFELLFTVTT